MVLTLASQVDKQALVHRRSRYCLYWLPVSNNANGCQFQKACFTDITPKAEETLMLHYAKCTLVVFWGFVYRPQ